MFSPCPSVTAETNPSGATSDGKIPEGPRGEPAAPGMASVGGCRGGERWEQAVMFQSWREAEGVDGFGKVSCENRGRGG